jgi:hypothetical protein
MLKKYLLTLFLQVCLLQNLSAQLVKEVDVTALLPEETRKTKITSFVLSTSEDLLAIGFGNGYVMLLKFPEGDLIHLWKAHSSYNYDKNFQVKTDNCPIENLQFDANSQMLLSTGNTEAKVWKAKTAELILETQSFGQAVAAAFSPDARYLVVGGETLSKNASSYSFSNSLLGIYDLKDFSLVHSVLVKKEQGFKKIAFDVNGVYLAIWTGSNQLLLINFDKFKNKINKSGSRWQFGYVLNQFHFSQRGDKIFASVLHQAEYKILELDIRNYLPELKYDFSRAINSRIEFGNNLVAIQHHIKTPIFQLNTMETLLVGVHLDEVFICDLVEKGCKGFIKGENPSHIIVSKDAKHLALADKKGKIKIFSW